MSHFSDYMDGVPVKISEKYKRPPRIDLPYSVAECPLRAQNVVDNLQYCSIFENNVLSKVKELRSAKVTKKNERRHRLQLLQEAKQKKLDEIATAEAQEKLKQLSVSDVSYPSTDEISALSPDDNTDRNCDITPTQDNSPDNIEVVNDHAYPTCSKAEPKHNILQPTPIPVQNNYIQNSLLDDPDPLQELKMNTKISKVPHYRNMDTLTYKDFENDTSSPFDNVELKTINEMELLSQVLQSQRDSSNSCQPQNYAPDPMYNMSNCASQAHMDGMTYLPNTYMEQPIQGPNVYSPTHYPVTNGYYMPTDNVCDNMQMDNVNMYMPNYQYYVPANPYPVVDPYYQNQMTNSDGTSQNSSPYITQGYYYYPPSQVPPNPQAYPTNVYNNILDSKMQESSSHVTIKSRSRSVPDIVNELNEEILMAKRRANERSYNASPAPKMPDPHSSVTKNEVQEQRRSRRKKEILPNPYEKLSPKHQEMCQKIHNMGFSLDRVARVCALVGDNDKKIIEGLLLVNELMDLGFPEGQVSAALAKHEFNRDKALDELVS